MSTIKANDIQNASGGIPTVKGQKLIPTAWVNFNGTGTVAIRDSENVSSITDDGTGRYIINFETAMANTDYSAQGDHNTPSGHQQNVFIRSTYTTTQVKVETTNSTYIDVSRCNVTIMGGQA